MADETTNITPEPEQDVTTQVQAPVSNPFDDESWGEAPVKSDDNVPRITSTTDPKVDDEEILDPKEWLKREFDTDDISVLKAEREEYKKLKAEPSREFANEQSKALHELIRQGKNPEVRAFLEKQEKLETLVSSEVTDDTAGDILKMQLRLKHTDLTDKEIEYKFNKQYGIPKEPVHDFINETDDEFEARKVEWQANVDDIKTNRNIEAKLAKPELAKLKAELVLPDINQKGNQSPEATQEELAAFNKEKDNFLQNAEKSINGFTGFSVQVKDKDVDYAVSYAPSQEEKTFVDGKLKTFAESGFDANSLLAERWVEPDGKTIKVEQMVKDLSRIYSDEMVSQKLVMDAVNKRMEAYLKDKKQIEVNGKNPAGTFDPSNAQTEMDKVRENAFA